MKVLKKNGQIMLSAKAFNGRVILEWIAKCLADFEGTQNDARLSLLSSCACLGSNFFISTHSLMFFLGARICEFFGGAKTIEFQSCL